MLKSAAKRFPINSCIYVKCKLKEIEYAKIGDPFFKINFKLCYGFAYPSR